jgi:predicted nucleic acid-binding protein
MIKLAVALDGVTQIGLDTTPFIYFVERNPVYVDRVREVVRRIAAGTIIGHTSVITLTEVLVQPLRQGNALLAQRYCRFLTRSRNLVLDPIHGSIAERAAELRARHGLRTPDALHLATALSSNCTVFLTNDIRLQRVTEIQVLVLDDLEL